MQAPPPAHAEKKEEGRVPTVRPCGRGCTVEIWWAERGRSQLFTPVAQPVGGRRRNQCLQKGSLHQGGRVCVCRWVDGWVGFEQLHLRLADVSRRRSEACQPSAVGNHRHACHASMLACNACRAAFMHSQLPQAPPCRRCFRHTHACCPSLAGSGRRCPRSPAPQPAASAAAPTGSTNRWGEEGQCQGSIAAV